MVHKVIRYFLENKLLTILLVVALLIWGLVTAPFQWHIPFLPKDSVPVDAIPDIGENQQLVFTAWPGKSPRDVEDQISYPLTSALLGIPGVKSVRASSVFGFSSIYIIFQEEVDFYWSRARILEKLNALPAGLLPEEVKPSLGPDATALGQVFWYTLEGMDEQGNATGGWDLHEIRSVQDFYVKYALSAVEDVAEVASVGGYVQEYQIDLKPDALTAYHIGISQVVQAVQQTNRDAGANTMEINKAEYLIRGLGYIHTLEDIEEAVVAFNNDVPVRIKDVAHVNLGPATRRGVLDKEGAEVVGGVVVARYGANPLQVIQQVKQKINAIAPGLPQKTLADGTTSQLTIVPFYDRTQLIHETIGTLERALTHEVLISIIVVIVLVLNLRAAALIAGMLPLAVLFTFIIMRYAGVDANIVALSGIAIAIGVMVDVGIILVENILRHHALPENKGARGTRLMEVIYRATIEVAPAITTALATTVVSFLPVFAMQAAEGKLFKPLAFTKTFALTASFFLGMLVLPAVAHLILSWRYDTRRTKQIWNILCVLAGITLAIVFGSGWALVLVLIGLHNLFKDRWPQGLQPYVGWVEIGAILIMAAFLLTSEWMPLGHQQGIVINFLFVVAIMGLILAVLQTLVHFYEPLLRWSLSHKRTFVAIPLLAIFVGVLMWLGVARVGSGVLWALDKVNIDIRNTRVWITLEDTFPGIGREFMPSLNEGSFLLMPTTMPHAGMEESRQILQRLDQLVATIPEVDVVVGKLGRTESALDPAPISMYENIIHYKPEFVIDEDGARQTFRTDTRGRFILSTGDTLDNQQALRQQMDTRLLIPDPGGQYFRNWRPHIHSPDDIWNEIIRVSQLPGVTSAPKLQPIETRVVMLQTGMRAPMGIKVFGPDLQTINDFAHKLEVILKAVPTVKAEAVYADRVMGKPYINLVIDRKAIARYGLTVEAVQRVIETAIGGKTITTTVEGRERYPVRVRYPREQRDDPEDIKKIRVRTPLGGQVLLGELVAVQFEQGPQVIKSEETFLTCYVLFDKRADQAEVDVVNDAQRAIQEKLASGQLTVPQGVNYTFSGTYENQVRAMKRLAIVIPISLALIFLLLYFQFKTITASAIHFSGVFVAFAGGFIMIWLYGQDWFMNFSLAGVSMRELFQMHTIHLSVAVWVGFIALFGIATDDGVIMGTYIHQVFQEREPNTVQAVREAVVVAGKKRVRPAMMTAATAIIALLPVLTATGKGADIMVPMAIPTLGGMIIQLMTIFVVPVLQAWWRESVVKASLKKT